MLSTGHSKERPRGSARSRPASAIAKRLPASPACSRSWRPSSIGPSRRRSISRCRTRACRGPRSRWSCRPNARPWEAARGVRRASVSAFGFSGTNAHAILEEAPVPAPLPDERPGPAVVAISGRDAAALRELSERLAHGLDANPGVRLNDFALTTRRPGGPSSRTASRSRPAPRPSSRTNSSSTRAANRRRRRLPARSGRGTAEDRVPVHGSGAQYAGMGRGLYDSEPVFRGCDRSRRQDPGAVPSAAVPRGAVPEGGAELRRSARPHTRNRRCSRSSTRFRSCGGRGVSLLRS